MCNQAQEQCNVPEHCVCAEFGGKKLRGGEIERDSMGWLSCTFCRVLFYFKMSTVNRKIIFDRNPKKFRLPFSKLKSAARRVSGSFM
jgi:hypothetical protein